MKTLEHNQLLEYLKHAIDLETAILTQKRIIAEYEESSLKRKPFLMEKERPPYPRREMPEKNPGDDFSTFFVVMLIVGILFTIIGIGLLMYDILGSAAADGATVSKGAVFVLLIIGIGMMILYFSNNSKENEKTKEIWSKYYREMEQYRKEEAEIEEFNSNAKKEYQYNLNEWNTSNSEAREYLQAPLSETEQALKALYEADIIYPKYHNLPALTSIYEYLITGRCEELAGAHGAYNLYEDEVRKDTVISQLNVVIENLEQIKQNQYMLYEKVVGIQKAAQAIAVVLIGGASCVSVYHC